MPDKPTLHVDPEALRASAKVLRGLPATIDAQRVKLYPLTLYPGEFSAGEELKTALTKGVELYDTALSVMSRTFGKTADAMDSAATLLSDADSDNDGFATQDISAVGGKT